MSINERRGLRPCPICERPLIDHATDCPYPGSLLAERQRLGDALDDMEAAIKDALPRWLSRRLFP